MDEKKLKEYFESLHPDELKQAENEWLATEHEQDTRQAVCDGDKAVDLLKAAAGYLERREQMPFPLADHIARAFRMVTDVKGDKLDNSHTSEARRDKLAAALYITAPNKRPKVDSKQFGDAVFRVMTTHAQEKKPISETAAAKEVALKYGMESTAAKDHWANWKGLYPDKYALLCKVVKAYK